MGSKHRSYSYMNPVGKALQKGFAQVTQAVEILTSTTRRATCTEVAKGGYRSETLEKYPKGSREPTNRVLRPKDYTFNGIWALEPYYLGPIYPYIIPIFPYISPYDPCKGTLLFGSLDPQGMGVTKKLLGRPGGPGCFRDHFD